MRFKQGSRFWTTLYKIHARVIDSLTIARVAEAILMSPFSYKFLYWSRQKMLSIKLFIFRAILRSYRLSKDNRNDTPIEKSWLIEKAASTETEPPSSVQ